MFRDKVLPPNSDDTLQWIPVRIGGRYATVRWQLADASVFTAPFFNLAVSRLHTREHETDLDVLLAIADREHPRFTPCGLIVHMTRCGSTLVLNALKEAESVSVLGEAQPFAFGADVAASLSPHWSRIGLDVLRASAQIFGTSALAKTNALVIKYGVAGLKSLKALRAAWPHVPCLIIVRNPVEVLVSNLNPVAEWLTERYELKNVDVVSRLRTLPMTRGVTSSEASDEAMIQVCAETLGEGCEAALSCIDSLCTVLDYEDICLTTILAVAERFGLCFSASGRLRLEQCLTQDAKARHRKFVNDSERKRQAATSAVHEAVEKWMEAPYRRLRAFRTFCAGVNGATQGD